VHAGKRGVLLHGPGHGKTHAVRYLIGRLRHATVIVLSGRTLRMLDQAAALAGGLRRRCW
jgi:hypothetical protein